MGVAAQPEVVAPLGPCGGFLPSSLGLTPAAPAHARRLGTHLCLQPASAPHSSCSLYSVSPPACHELILTLILSFIDLHPPPAEAFPDVDVAFRVMWADHGDEISRQYAGTGAMKARWLGRAGPHA